MRAAILVLAVLLSAASRPGCGSEETYDPCAGKACGEGCQVCPPDARDCAETLVVKACDPQGRCVPGTPGTCRPADAPHPDCAGKTCGASCNPCGPDATCPTLIASACDRHGQCVGAVPWLCYDPCAGKACGESCSHCPPLPEGEGCAEPAVVQECDASGRCTLAPAACGG